jgi:arylsulfatase A-like enzyme
MLSGQYPTVHAVIDLRARIDPERTPLLPSILRGAGYMTGAFTGGRLVHHAFGFHEGFDTYFEPDPCWRDNADRLLSWVDKNRGLPFFLFFHTYVVHDYAWNTPDYIERFDPGCESTLHRHTTYAGFEAWLKGVEKPSEADLNCLENRYAAGIRMADDALRRLVESLESAGAMENTLLVITSDHGEELLERGRIQHGRTLYEEQIHVPLILRPPGGIAPRAVPDLVEVIDVPPTILDCLGLPLPPGIQGRSLLPFLDPAFSGSADPPAYSEVEFGVNKYALRSRKWKIILSLDPPGAGGGEGAAHELYDLTGDPNERRDLAERAPEFDAFRKQLDAFRRELQAVSSGMARGAGRSAPLDPALLDELRAQGYVK